MFPLVPNIDGVLRVLDRFVAERDRQELDSLYRARLTLLLLSLVVVGGSFNGWAILRAGGTLVAVAVGGMALLAGGLILGMRLGLDRETAARVLVWLCSPALLYSMWATGGLRATITVTYAICIPLTAMALLGRRQAYKLSLMLLGAFLLTWLCHIVSWLPKPAPHGAPEISRLLVTSSLLLFYLMGLAGFQSALNERQRLDLDEARRQADQANRAKSAFLANMSHELRTPMNGVLGLTQALLNEGELSPRQQDTLGSVLTSGESLVALLNDILDLSKIEAGRLELETLDYQPAEVARSVARLLGPSAAAKGLDFRSEVEDAGWVKGDPTRLRQVLLNLLGNAIKFTSTGGVVLRMKPRGDLLEVQIQDSGIGIPLATQQQLFQPFSQADASTTRRYGGTGLGLAISRQLVSLMGGEIELVSEPGQGSTFSFTVSAPPGRPQPVAQAESSVGQLATGLRVLVAEDNPVNRMVADRLLRKLGVQPVIVEDGQAAVEALLSARFDVVLMDVHMPVLDGLEATRQLRELGHTLPVIAMTAGTMAEDRSACEDAGMDGFLAKPVQLEALGAALRGYGPSGRISA
ncbi:MAG: ATP-binding protein [Myxococcota bacterium]|nr:ATP-binding protein [Myxococcota bacterium]